MASTCARRGLDRGAVAGGDALLVHQRAAHADEGGAGREIGGDVAGLDAAGRAERDAGQHAGAARGYAPGPPTEEAGNTFTTSAPAASAARTSVGVSAPSISTAPAARHGAASDASIQGATMKRAPAARQVSAVAAVGHGAGADQQRRIGAPVRGSMRAHRGSSW